MIQLDFKCPLCGGSSFGSAWYHGLDGPCTRACHGDDAGDGMRGCLFEWPEIDDWKYFTYDGVKAATFHEYEQVMVTMRSTPVIGRGPYHAP